MQLQRRTRVLSGVLICFGVLGLSTASHARPHPSVPSPGELNRYVVKVLESYPTDGTHRYNWPKDGSYDGVTRDLEYGGQVVGRANAKKDAYCCGLTFEVFLRAWEFWCKNTKRRFAVGSLNGPGIKKLRSDWYCAGDVRSGPVAALVNRGLGAKIEQLEDARAGDFVQLWRSSGSGHSVIFIDWVRDRKGAILGMRYWSTQKSTKGIGYRVERFTGANAIDRDKLYIARVGAR